MDELERAVLREVAGQLDELASGLWRLLEDGGEPWMDRTAEMPLNHEPFHPDFVAWAAREGWGNCWPTRDLADVTGVTVHHTISHSPVATAQYCAFSKGYPSVQYHLWVSAGDGCPVWLLAPLEWMLWHDNTGAHQTTLSVGVAGRWDRAAPSDEQVAATASLCRHLMGRFGFGTDQVRGHLERAGLDRYGNPVTVCPGWRGPRGEGDLWRSAFYGALGDG